MEINKSQDVIGLLTQKMMYDNQKSSVHAQNVANADTPNYKARELTPFTFNDALKQASAGMAVTDPKHIVPASMAGSNARTIRTKPTEVLPSGNSVDLANEMMEVSKTAIDYQQQVSVLKKVMGLFRIALKGQ